MRRVILALGGTLVLLVALAGVRAAVNSFSQSGVFTGPIVVGSHPTVMAVDERTGRAFVVNQWDNTVSVLDIARGTLLRTVAVGAAPEAVAVDERTARAFVVASNTNLSGNALGPGIVSVLDSRTGALLRSVSVGQKPGAVAIDPQTDRVFVANWDSMSVSVLEAQSGRVLQIVAVGLGPTAIAVDTVRRHVFVANRGCNTMSMLDSVSGRVLRTVPVGTPTEYPVGLAVDPVAGRVVVRTDGENGAGPLTIVDELTGAVRSFQGTAGGLLLAENPRSGLVFTRDTGSNMITLRAIRTGATVNSAPWPGGGLALDWLHSASIDAHTGRVYVANWDGTVQVLDGRTGQLLCQKDAGQQIYAIVVAPRRRQVLVTNIQANRPSTSDAWGWVPPGLRAWLPWLPHRSAPVSPTNGSGTVTVLSTAC